jgi:uncharacterized protein
MADNTIDQQFIEYIVKSLVSNPDKVRVERTIDEKGVLLELYVEPEDLGRVIGRNGSTAKSIRILLRALGVKNDARYNLKIVDTNEGERPPRREREDRSEAAAVVADAPEEMASEEPSPEPEIGPIVDDQAPASNLQSDDSAAVASTDDASEPEEEDSLSRHRQDLKDLTDLDI